MAATTGLFNNASNVGINQASISTHNTTNQYNNYGSKSHGGQSELERLAEFCAFGAFLNSNERPDPPRCKPKTRIRLLSEIKAWVEGGEDEASAMWLVGCAGSGKTALGQTTAEQMKKERRMLACHFFWRTSKDGQRSDGHRLVPNMVYQMVQALPGTLPYVKERIKTDQSIFNRQPDGLLEELFLGAINDAINPNRRRKRKRRSDFVNALMKLLGVKDSAMGSTPIDTTFRLLVVIDGLDECDSPEMQAHIIKAISSLIPKLPIPIRFLIASRPETHIRMAFNHEFKQDLRIINLDEDQDARKDIEQYFVDRFDDIRQNHPAIRFQEAYVDWPPLDDITSLVDRSSLTFIFADTVMNYIGHISGHPAERLEVILGLAIVPVKDKPYLPLDTIYTFILLTVEETHRPLVWQILSILYIAGKTEFAESKLESSPRFLEEFLNLRPGKVFSLLDPLVSLLALPNKPESQISLLHASLFDFLIDPIRSGDLAVQLSGTHKFIAERIADDASAIPYTIVPFPIMGTPQIAPMKLYSAPLIVPTRLSTFVLHASHADRSATLIRKAYALQDFFLQGLAESYREALGAQSIREDSRQAYKKLLDIACELSRIFGSKRDENPLEALFSEKGLSWNRMEMAQLTIDLSFKEVGDFDYLSLISELKAGIAIFVGPSLRNERLSGRLTVTSCVPLLQAMMRKHGRELYRKDSVELIADPKPFLVANYVHQDGAFAAEVIKFLRGFNQNRYNTLTTNIVPSHQIQAIIEEWERQSESLSGKASSQ